MKQGASQNIELFNRLQIPHEDQDLQREGHHLIRLAEEAVLLSEVVDVGVFGLHQW